MYATEQDLIDLASEEEILMIADRDGDGTVDPDVISAALAYADNTINGYLAVRYRLPLNEVPELVRSWAASIARYRLHRDGAPEHVVRDWKSAVSDLKEVARGNIDLSIADGSQPTTSSNGTVSIEGSEPVFTKEKLGGWL
ncbi:DUF1320 domain-containing protein [uncultured Cohaesibacter sp.]|uniref:gp436 family protein n=1 Tax=uncultured Cohaesibacter sp. TaxID=1002546 RepID=UPI0029C79EE7|nr:DUF1320 domain-containing protein [uncultured Cohaesibacter sp.]